MQLLYERMPGGNFGDDMNLWFWDEAAPGWRDWGPGRTLFGIGTIINTRNLSNHPDATIMGSGVGYGHVEPLADPQVEIGWVRGPRSARALGLSEDMAIADPAILTPRFTPPSEGKRRAVFVPHATTARLALDWDGLCGRAGLDYLSPKGESRAVIAVIRDAEFVVAESMHAAIIADAFRVPWTPVAVSNQFNHFKWGDWMDSLGLDSQAPIPDPLALPKAAHAWLKSLRARLRPAPRAAAPSATPAEPSSDGDETQAKRERLKAMLARFSGPMEMILSRGLRRAAAQPRRLSADADRGRAIERIDERLHAIRARYAG